MNGKEFAQWMDETGISMAAAAELFGVSEQTLYNWRSTVGVPDRKLEWVRAQMEAYGRKAERAAETDRVVLEITDEQFAAWNDAALAAGLRLKEWAITSLDEVAATDPTLSGPAPDPVALVRETETPYRTPKKTEGAA